MIDLTERLNAIQTPDLNDKYSLSLWNDNISALKDAIVDVNNSVVNPEDYVPDTVVIKPTVSTESIELEPANWIENQYSFESTYPVDIYDLEIEINGDIATEEQIAAWCKAQIRGSVAYNKIYCSVVPEINIPIFIKATEK